jgi:hypothetical protein
MHRRQTESIDSMTVVVVGRVVVASRSGSTAALGCLFLLHLQGSDPLRLLVHIGHLLRQVGVEGKYLQAEG